LPATRQIIVTVRNDGTHTDTHGVYVDVIPPGGVTNPHGCTPNGRVIQTTVSLSPGQETIVSTTQTFDCANQAAARGKTYRIIAAVDHGGDDSAACGPSTLNSRACFTALADDDDDDRDNRRGRTVRVRSGGDD
jgi:hypothetical protein